MTVNFKSVKDQEIFNQLDYNEYYLRDVTESTSSKGYKMWTLHLLPVSEKNIEGKDFFGRMKYNNSFETTIVFSQDNDEIINKNFVSYFVSQLYPQGKNIISSIEKVCNDKKNTIWIKGIFVEYTKKDGSIGMKIEMDKFQKEKPEDTKSSIEEQTKKLKQIIKQEAKQEAEDGEEDLPF